MDARDFAGLMLNGKFNFGLIGPSELAMKLRSLADRIEKNESPHIVLQEAYSCEGARHDDFYMTTLVLQFASLATDAKKGAALYGNNARFPYEIAPGPGKVLTQEEVREEIGLEAVELPAQKVGHGG